MIIDFKDFLYVKSLSLSLIMARAQTRIAENLPELKVLDNAELSLLKER